MKTVVAIVLLFCGVALAAPRTLLMVIPRADVLAAPSAKRQAMRDRIEDLIVAAGDRQTFILYTNVAGDVYYVGNWWPEQISPDAPKLSAARTALTNICPNAKLVVTDSAVEDLRNAGLFPKGYAP